MTYHVVFDISERFPDLAIGLAALAGLVTFLVLLLVLRDGKGARTKPLLWLGAGVGLLAAFGIHNIGGQYGILAAVWGVAFPSFAVGNVAKLTTFPRRGGGPQPHSAETVSSPSARLVATVSSPSARLVATIIAPILLALVALSGCQQISALNLSRQLTAGG